MSCFSLLKIVNKTSKPDSSNISLTKPLILTKQNFLFSFWAFFAKRNNTLNPALEIYSKSSKSNDFLLAI